MSATDTRPMFVGVELRFPIEEVEAMEPFLGLFANLIKKGVMTCPDHQREPLLNGLDRLAGELKRRQEPFES